MTDLSTLPFGNIFQVNVTQLNETCKYFALYVKFLCDKRKLRLYILFDRDIKWMLNWKHTNQK
jgi:hypothetical protein